jgi:hypothetical protein
MERLGELGGEAQVPEVDRIEGAAEEADRGPLDSAGSSLDSFLFAGSSLDHGQFRT